MPKNFVWYKGLSQLFVDETHNKKKSNIQELTKQAKNAEKLNDKNAKIARMTKSDYNLKRCGMRSLLIMS